MMSSERIEVKIKTVRPVLGLKASFAQEFCKGMKQWLLAEG